jgi:hypothetical protein
MFNRLTGFLSVAAVFLTETYAQTNAQTNSTIIVDNNPTGISTATILGGVAVAISGVGALGFVIHYFRNGGSLSGLARLTYKNRDVITENMNKLPLDDLKKHLGVDDDLKKLEEYKKRAEEIYNKLPDSVKEKIKDNLTAENLIELVENPNKFQEKIQEKLKSESSNLSEHAKQALDKLPVPDEMKSKIEYQLQNIIQKQLESSNSNEQIQIELKENPLESSTLTIKKDNDTTIESASIQIV